MAQENVNPENLIPKVIDGGGWKFAEKIGVQVVQFVIQIALARILVPEEFGVVGLVSVYIAVIDVLISQGLIYSLIQKKEISSEDYSTCYCINVILAIFLYGLLYFLAPSISCLYSDTEFAVYLRTLGVTIIFNALCSVHNAILSRELEYKKSFYRHAVAIAAYGVVGIVLSLCGFGIWALIISKVVSDALGCITLLLSVKWDISFKYSSIRAKYIFDFGSKILFTNFINTVFNNFNSFFIGAYFDPTSVGYYQKGQQIPQTFMVAIDGSVNEVMFSSLSRMQKRLDLIYSYSKKFIHFSIFLVYPMMLGLFVVSDNLVHVLLTEKWDPCVPYLKLQCLICLIWPFASLLSAMNAVGKSTITMALSLFSKVLTVAFAVALWKYGVIGIMIGTLLGGIVSLIINLVTASVIIKFNIFDFLMDMKKPILFSLIMAFCVKLVGYIGITNLLIILIIQIGFGAIIFVSLSYIFKEEAFEFFCNFIKNRLIFK